MINWTTEYLPFVVNEKSPKQIIEAGAAARSLQVINPRQRKLDIYAFRERRGKRSGLAIDV